MKILVLNSGSSSIKTQFFVNQERYFKAVVEEIGSDNSTVDIDCNFNKSKENFKIEDHSEAIKIVLDKLLKSEIIKSLEEIDAVGHRVVHGGELYSDSILIDDEVIDNIEKLSEFAPLHNPPNLTGIKACREHLPDKPQVAVFDTAFHSTIPKKNYIYALPINYYKENKIRKYGFHGTSFKYITQQINENFSEFKKVIICHIGNGSSVCAVKDGKSIDTSMGFTPLAGLIMGTRSGDIDPALVNYLCELESKKEGKEVTSQEITKILNKESGLKGVAGVSDMREIWNNIEKNDDSEGCMNSNLALDMLSNSILKYVSYYVSQLNGVDAIVFTAGLGENAYYLREKILQQLSYLGIEVDLDKNENNGKESNGVITSDSSKVKALVVPTNEELMIAKDTECVVNTKEGLII